MTRRNILLATLMLLPLTAAPASHALAQEAIMLETVGAVRMASPAEVKAMNDEAARQQQQQQTAQPAPAPQRQAVITN